MEVHAEQDWQSLRDALLELAQRLGSMRAVGRQTGITATTLLDYVNIRGRMPNADMVARLVEPLWDEHEDLCRRLIAASGYPATMFLPTAGTLDTYAESLGRIAAHHNLPVEEVVQYLIDAELKRERNDDET